MTIKQVYRDDLLNRFASHTFTETVIDDMTLVEFKNGSSVVVGASKVITVGDAYVNIRKQMNVMNNVICELTTAQIALLTGTIAGTQILNSDTGSVQTYNGSEFGGNGLNPRIDSYLSTDLTLDTALEEKVVVFDVDIRSIGVTLSGGEFTIPVDGRYHGHFTTQIDETSDPTFLAWVEVKPLATGVWELSGGMIKTKIKDDTFYTLNLDGTLELLEGDKVRVKTMIINGSPDKAILKGISQVVSLGTLTQPSATISIDWIGDLTPP